MQSDNPRIAERGAIVVNGQKRSDYATFEDINDVIKPIMQAHGFAITFKVETVPSGLSVAGILMNRAGHRESTTMLLPLDTSGSGNAVQAVGSSTSYGKRYVMSALLNITTRGEDDGHAAVPSVTVTPIQARQLQALLDKCSERQKTRSPISMAPRQTSVRASSTRCSGNSPNLQRERRQTIQIISDVEQGTQEWLDLRLGIVTCSELDCLLVNGKGEAGFGAGAFTYMNTLIGERITGEAADPFQGNRHTERGYEYEGTARVLYQAQADVTTHQVGIILNHGIGYS